MPTSFLAGCVQLTSKSDVGQNLATCARLVAAAAARGAKIVVLPENFAFIGLHEDDKLEIAETLDESAPGPILSALSDMARAAGVWVIAGGMPEQVVGEPKKVHNTCVVISDDGHMVATYRKIHLFDIQIPGNAEFMESRTVVPGNRAVAVETPWGRIGLSICYDIRFPELYRMLVSEGARLIVVPAAFTMHTGKDHWHALLRARAIENQVYVLAAAQFGKPNDKRVCYGHSLIVDPWGPVIAER